MATKKNKKTKTKDSRKSKAAAKAAATDEMAIVADDVSAHEESPASIEIVAADTTTTEDVVDFETAAAAVIETDEATGGDDVAVAIDPETGEALFVDESTEETSLDRLESIIESLLFASDRPLANGDLKRILGERGDQRVKQVMEQLVEKHAATGIRVVLTAGGWRMQTSPDNDQWVQRLVAGRPVRLSRALMETLAIVAYKQPITRPEIDDIRGVDAGPVLKTLLDRQLIRVIGKKEDVGRPLLYGTTPEFLRVFNLKDLTDLPTLREFHELGEADKALVDATHGTAADETGAASTEAGAAAETPSDVVSGEDRVGEAVSAPTPAAAHPFEARPQAMVPDYLDDEDDSLLDELEEATSAVSRALHDSRRDTASPQDVDSDAVNVAAVPAPVPTSEG